MSQIYSTHNESPPPVYYVQNPPDIKAHINEEATSWSKCLKLLLLLTIAFLIGLIFIAVVACSLIFGTPNGKSPIIIIYLNRQLFLLASVFIIL